MNLVGITRRIRACEGEAAAQLLLEYAIREEREACAKLCEEISGNEPSGERFGALDCAAAIRKRSHV